MPRRQFYVPPIAPHEIVGLDIPQLVRIINDKIEDLNRFLVDINLMESQLRGEDGYTVTFTGTTIDFGGANITNVGSITQEPVPGAPPDSGLLVLAAPGSTDKDLIHFHERDAPLPVISGDLILPGFATLPMHAVPLQQMQGVVTMATRRSSLPRVVDGQDIDLEDLDGVNGRTGGVLLFGLGPDKKARPIVTNPAGIRLDTESLESKLEELQERLIAEDRTTEMLKKLEVLQQQMIELTKEVATVKTTPVRVINEVGPAGIRVDATDLIPALQLMLEELQSINSKLGV